jgi:succinate dehydrogenase / fumarate reductase cytochrome b subunit
LYTPKPFFDVGYHRFLGTWAWIMHRLAGLALIFYLCLHIWIINTLTKGPEAFNGLMQFLGSPLFKYLEIGLWGVILFHAFNGMRIVAIDFFKGSLYHKKLFFILILFGVLLWLSGAVILIGHIGDHP